MSLFDTVKEKASDALETTKDVAHTQQLKLQLRKLEGEVKAASAELGAAAFDLIEAGTLAAGGGLDSFAARVREARAAVDAKRTEITNAGGDHDDDDDDAVSANGDTSQS